MDPLTLSGEGKDGRGFKLSESKITPFNLPRPVRVLREVSVQLGIWRDRLDVDKSALNSLVLTCIKIPCECAHSCISLQPSPSCCPVSPERAFWHVFQNLCLFFLSSPLFFLLKGVTSHCPSGAFIRQEKHPETSTV